jgi:hypothetical protein
VDKKEAFNKFKGKYLDSDSTGLKILNNIYL